MLLIILCTDGLLITRNMPQRANFDIKNEICLFKMLCSSTHSASNAYGVEFEQQDSLYIVIKIIPVSCF